MENPDYHCNALQYYISFSDLANMSWIEFLETSIKVCVHDIEKEFKLMVSPMPKIDRICTVIHHI
jgi:hypothetical protein